MKSLVLTAPGIVELRDLPMPAPGHDEVLVKTGASTICTSDLNDIKDNPFGISLPVVIGHEASGTIVAVGSEVAGFSVGERVATHPVHHCGKCAACAEGLMHLCLDMGHFGINRQGTFAEYYTVRADRARRLPPQVDYVLGSLAEPVSVCLEALAQASLAPGMSLLVIGDGPFGLLTARLALRMGLKEIVVAGRHEFRLSMAGGARTINTAGLKDPSSELRTAVGGLGFDAVVLAAGSREAVAQGIAALKPKGRLVVFSAFPRDSVVDLFTVHVKELEIIGACNDQGRFDEALVALGDDRLDLKSLVTHRLPFERYREGFSLASSGRESALKVSLVFSGESL